MARTKKKIDEKLFRRVVKEVEEAEEFTNRSKLYEAVAKRYNNILRDIKMSGANTESLVGKMFPEITTSIVLLRINELKINIKTKVGERGRPKGSVTYGEPVKRTPRAEKFQQNPKIVQSLKEIRKELWEKPHWYTRIAEGSLITAVKAHCFLCSGNSTAESRQCKMLSCPLWIFLERKEYLKEN